jgi:hypothetical protein
MFPKLKIKLKELYFADISDIQEAVIYELKKVQKEEFSAAFQKKSTTAQKPVFMPLELILNKKGLSPCVFGLKKKISPKTFGPNCV